MISVVAGPVMLSPVSVHGEDAPTTILQVLRFGTPLYPPFVRGDAFMFVSSFVRVGVGFGLRANLHFALCISHFSFPVRGPRTAGSNVRLLRQRESAAESNTSMSESGWMITTARRGN
jgi:hypothetical protein